MLYARNPSCGRCARKMGKCLCSTYLVKFARLKTNVGHAYSAKRFEIFKNHLIRGSQLWSQMVYNWFLVPGFTGSGKISRQQPLSDLAENWSHNVTQHEKTKNGICKPFCQNPSVGFPKYYVFQVSGSHSC